MPVKPKPKETLVQRYLPRAQHHPIITLSTLAIVVGLLVSVGPTIVWAIHYYETVEDHRQADAALRAIILQNRHLDDRNLAWATVQSVKTEITVAQNRVNDCKIKQQAPARMSPLEQSVCTQYQRDLDDAQHRFDDARKTALDLSKD